MKHTALAQLPASVMKNLRFLMLFVAMQVLLAGINPSRTPEKTIWKLTGSAMVGGYQPVVLGAPLAVHDRSGTSLFFNGASDGLIIPANPLMNWPKFTIEVLFKPDGTGPAAPRFVHFQDKDENRGTLEIRVTPDGNWYLDAFLKNGKTNKGLTLIDSLKLHACDQWYWAAMVYDGKQMTSYVNGIKELQGAVDFVPMTTGQISLGVRLNKVNWYKGLIREIRFNPEILNAKALQHKLPRKG